MAGPINLNAFLSTTTFPTWHWPKQTKFCVENLGSSSGKVRVRVTAEHDDIVVPPGQSVCIDRSWAGGVLLVGNIGNSPLKVWTE